MSHVVDFSDVEIASIEALKLAIKLFCPTLEIVKSSHYRTWKDNNGGRLVGDWPLPTGITEKDVGENAEYVIRVNDKRFAELGYGARDQYDAPYEIGVVRSKKTGTFSLFADFWNQGNGLLSEKGVGEYNDAKSTAFDNLYQMYRMAEAKLTAEANGDQIEFEQQPNNIWLARVNTEARLGM